jgi:DNA-binding MarR family transcriptional regulator
VTFSSSDVEAPVTPAPARELLIADLLAEMGAWSARGRLGAMRRWHRGALSLIHLNVLNALEVDGPLSMTAVADALDVSIASATGIVDRMAKRDLVERRHSTDDRRVVEVHLTAHGLATIREMESQLRTHMQRIVAELSDDELAGLLLGVRGMHRARQRLHPETAAEGPAAR